VNQLHVPKVICILFVFCAATAIASPAQVLTTLYSFSGGDGANPVAGLLQGSDGNFYGTTRNGGAGYGTVFGMYPNGSLETFSFDGSDGAFPYAGVIESSDGGGLYGTTYDGGAYNQGTVFGSGSWPLYSFCSQANCADGANPNGLLQASDGNFYGTTDWGGTYRTCNGFGSGCGTVFQLTPNGTLTTLHSFNYNDGAQPNGLIQASDGNFYGVTANGGGNNGDGTIFKITPDGTLTPLHGFSGGDGEGPNGLVQARDGNFYGTAWYGGAYRNCFLACGTVFRMTPNGSLTVLHSFNGSDGAYPASTVIQGSDGNFYGTTSTGGANRVGTIFKITPNGTLTTLHSFSGSDGAVPHGALVQATDGNFYGTTLYGGANGQGTVFRLVTVRPCITCRSVE